MLNYFQSQSKSGKLFIFTAVFLVLFLGFLSFGMVYMDNSMSGCPLMPGMSICNMSPLEHVSVFQKMFTSVNFRGVLNILALTLLAFVFIYSKKLFSSPQDFKYSFVKINQKEIFVSYLEEAFSSGLLNPKTF